MKTTRLSWAAIALTLFISLLLAACGSAGAEGPTPTPPVIALDTPTPAPSLAAIGGRVWRDTCQIINNQAGAGCIPLEANRYRANGMQDAGEPGVSGVVVAISLGACPAPVAATTQTDANGFYAFNGVPEGLYCITIDPSAPQNQSLLAGGWTYPQVFEGSSPANTTVQITAGEKKSEVSFGRDDRFGWTSPAVTPSSTPTGVVVPTQIPPSPTATCSNRATFIADVTVPDKTNIAAGTTFVKTWRIQNSGSCPWSADYALVFVNGNQMQGQSAIPLGGSVTPGSIVDVSVTLVAPAANGVYNGEWQLRSKDGVLFGLGPNGDKPFWVQIVVGPTATPTFTRTPTPTKAPTITNWRGEYFNNRTLSGSPVLVRDDIYLDFDWSAGSPAANVPADNFAVRWTRSLNFNAGTYRFRALADDGVVLWVDDQLVINDWKDGGAGEASGEIALTQGAHSLRVEYYEAAGLASFKLWWDAVGSPTYPDWKGEYWANGQFNGSPALVRNDVNVDFDWGQGAPAAGLPADNFTARWSRWVTFDSGIYRFSINADDGVRLYLDGQPIINEWHNSDGSQTYVAERYLTGPHSLLIEYSEQGLRAMVKARWERLPNTPTPTPTFTPTATPTATPTQPGLAATITGRVWLDNCPLTSQEYTGPGPIPDGCAIMPDSTIRANGVLDAGELGISNVTVTLVEESCDTVGTDLRSFETLTDRDGRFTFTNLRAGYYCLVIPPNTPQNAPRLLAGLWTKPVLSNPTFEATISLQVAPGEVKTGIELGWDNFDPIVKPAQEP